MTTYCKYSENKKDEKRGGHDKRQKYSLILLLIDSI